MKSVLFAAVATVATLAAAPAFAASGYAGAAVNWGNVQVAGDDDWGVGYNVSGAVSAPVSQAVSIQAEAAYADAEDADGVFSGALHLVGDLDGGMRVGAFVAAAEVADETAIGGGVEGQVQFERSSLSANAAYATVDDLDVDIWGLGGDYRFFVNDNLRIDGGASWASIDTPIGSTEAWGVGAGAEFKPESTPFSVFGGWSYAEADEIDVSANTFSLGIRVSFGNATLKDRDREGPSFNGANGLLSLGSF